YDQLVGDGVDIDSFENMDKYESELYRLGVSTSYLFEAAEVGRVLDYRPGDIADLVRKIEEDYCYAVRAKEVERNCELYVLPEIRNRAIISALYDEDVNIAEALFEGVQEFKGVDPRMYD
ncbi:hypothetical protein HN799_03440, partial [Candidatus Woesearchaeota archaeon]|nr:hypothetical protein [Candidatus Woesearchaeota archaeon]